MFRIIPLVMCLCSVAAFAAAEQRFYQVIDAQGNVQIIEMPASPAGKPAPSRSSPTPPDTPAPDGGRPAVPQPAVPVAPVAPAPAISDSNPTADSEDGYVDSEVLESTNFNPERKKRFYVLDDALGSRVEESDGTFSSPVYSGPSDAAQPTGVTIASFTTTEVETRDRDELANALGLEGGCLARKQLDKGVAIKRGQTASVVFDEKAKVFMRHGRIAAVVDVQGEGLRKLLLSSYSRKERAKEFFMPVLVFLNRDGCAVRMLSGSYFEREYGATKSRHPYVQGGIIMSSDEQYLVMLVGERASMSAPFPVAEFGEIVVEYK